MTQYLVAIYRLENYAPAVSEDEAMGREIDALNNEMEAAGIRVFVGVLQPESCARSLRLQPAGKVLITDRPYAETKEHIGGFGCWKPLTWTRRWRGGARPPSPVVRRSRCVRFTDAGPTEATERHGRGADRGRSSLA
jgi:hypothetical protein